MEFQQFGWNALTVSFLGTVLLTLVGAWGLWHQNKVIWKNESGRSVSVTLFVYFTMFYTAAGIYGLATNSVALIFTSTRAVLHVPILIGLWRFKGFSSLEKFLGACFLCYLGAMAVIPAKDSFFLLLLFGGVIFSLPQAYEIWRNKDAGEVEMKLLAASFLNTLFWTIYAFATGDWVLCVTSPLFVAVTGLTMVLWWVYRPIGDDRRAAT